MEEELTYKYSQICCHVTSIKAILLSEEWLLQENFGLWLVHLNEKLFLTVHTMDFLLVCQLKC